MLIATNAMLWWKVPIAVKIRIFMWLTHKNRILTKDNLKKKGWKGTDTCHFCNNPESINHLFVSCPFTKHIWFYLGSCQDVSIGWKRFSDIIKFSNQLPNNHSQAFILVFSAVC